VGLKQFKPYMSRKIWPTLTYMYAHDSSAYMKAPSDESSANQRKEHNAKKYIQWVITLSPTIWVYHHSKVAKFYKDSNL